jgi:hypothetical protein
MYGVDYFYLIIPKIHLGTRYYQNMQKRALKGKKTERNSGRYFALNAEYYSPFFNISNVDVNYGTHQLLVYPAIGFQRKMGKQFSYDHWLGLGPYFTSDGDLGLILRMDLRFGLLLNKNQLR